MDNSPTLRICNATTPGEVRDQGRSVGTSRLAPIASAQDPPPRLQKGGAEWKFGAMQDVRMLPIVYFRPVIFLFASLPLDQGN